MIYFAVDGLRAHLLPNYLQGRWGSPLADRMGQATYPELFRARCLARGAWIFTSLDALSPAELELVHLMQRGARDAGLPVLNPAREALHRFELLSSLHLAGINDFRVYRANQSLESVRYPVFVRIADEHDGSLTPLLYHRRQLWRALAYTRLLGLAREQVLVVEFCETASADGLYRKYSAFRVGDAYIARYLHAGPHWMTKEATRDDDQTLLAEELDFVRESPHAAWVRQVFEIARIQYGRLDYSVRNGRPQAWEINITPTIAGDPAKRKATAAEEQSRVLKNPAREHFHIKLREAFCAIDPGPLEGSEIRVEFPPGLVEQARCERRELLAIERHRQWVSKIAATRGFRGVGPLLRRTFRS